MVLNSQDDSHIPSMITPLVDSLVCFDCIGSHKCLCFCLRSKNFEKGSDYNKTWKASEDGKVNTNGPRMVVGDPNGGMISGGYVTRWVHQGSKIRLTPSCSSQSALFDNGLYSHYSAHFLSSWTTLTLGWWGGSVGSVGLKFIFHAWPEFESRRGHKKDSISFLSQKCADSLSVCPTPVCQEWSCTHVKIL